MQVEVAQTLDQKSHSATYELWVWFKKQGSWYVLPACCDIDRTYPSLMQHRLVQNCYEQTFHYQFFHWVVSMAHAVARLIITVLFAVALN